MLGKEAPRRQRIVVDIAMLLAFAAFLLTAALFYDRITTSREHQSDTNAAIRTVLCFAQAQAESDPFRTPHQRERAVRFYTEALKKIDELPCPRFIKPGGTP